MLCHLHPKPKTSNPKPWCHAQALCLDMSAMEPRSGAAFGGAAAGAVAAGAVLLKASVGDSGASGGGAAYPLISDGRQALLLPAEGGKAGECLCGGLGTCRHCLNLKPVPTLPLCCSALHLTGVAPLDLEAGGGKGPGATAADAAAAEAPAHGGHLRRLRSGLALSRISSLRALSSFARRSERTASATTANEHLAGLRGEWDEAGEERGC